MNFKWWLSLAETQLLIEDYKTQREKFIAQGFAANIVDNYLNTFKEIKDKKYKEIYANIAGVNVQSAQRANVDAYADFHELERVVDYVKGQRDLSKAKFTDIKFSGKPIYTGNGLEIYYADTPQACVQYKGNVPYGWCIARPDASNMFYTYRYKPHEPAFYFVKNLEKTQAEFGLWNATKTVFSGKFRDKYHFFVVQVVRNANPSDPNKKQYIVTSAQNDGDQQMSWNELVALEPKLQGLQNVLVSKPLSGQERQDYEKFKDGISDEAFSKLDYGEKNRYLDIAVRLDKGLSTGQFQMLPDDLKNKYISFGVGLNQAQYEIIAQNKPLFKRYQDITLRKFEEALKAEHEITFQPTEIDLIIKSPDFAEKVKATSNHKLIGQLVDPYPQAAIAIADAMLPETLDPVMIRTLIYPGDIKNKLQVGSRIIEKLGQEFNLEDMEALFVIAGEEEDPGMIYNPSVKKQYMPLWVAMGDELIHTKDLDDDEVNFLLDLTKSEKLAQYLVAKHGKNLSHGAVVAILHNIQSPDAAKLAMSMKDKLSPEEYQELFKSHYRNIHDQEASRKAKEKFYGAVGHHAEVLTYPDGHRWVEGAREMDPDSIKGDHVFYLISPSGEIEVGLQAVNGKVSVLHAEGKSVHSVMDKNPKVGKVEDLSQYYKHPSKWNDYIVDFINRKPDIVKQVHSISPDWNLGNLSPEQREKLFKGRPDAMPKVDFKTSDGYSWTKNDSWNNNKEYQLYDENWQPILSFVLDEHNDISRGNWHSPSISQMFTGKQEIDKNKFSKATAELILNKGIEHVDTREKNNYQWKFDDMLPEHQQMVLEKYPNFTDPFSYIQKRSDSKERSLNMMVSGAGGYGMKVDGDTVILDDHHTIQEKDLLASNFFAKALPQDSKTTRKIVELLDKKIHGAYGENDKWEFERLAKEGDLNTLKQKYPFADEEMMNLSREHGYRTSDALSHAIGKVIMPQVIKLLYEELKPYETDKFKIVFKDGKIEFVTSYDQIIDDYKKNHSLKSFMEEYKTWRQGLKVNWEDFFDKLNGIERNIDKEAFKNAISSYDANSRAEKYATSIR